MRVAHICSSVFTDGLTYQENLLAQQHHRDGHEVVIFAPTERIDSHARLVQCEPGWSRTASGIPLLRLPHPRGLPLRLAQKFRWMKGLREALETFRPDAALFHGPQSLSLLTFRNFQRRHPDIHCHVDCHSDPYTSGTSWLSRNILHRLFYRPIVRMGMRGLEPLLCISVDVQTFVARLYGFAPRALAFYPLGGIVHDDEAYRVLRGRGRARLGLSPERLVLLQTGKMDQRKRLTETLRAFREAAIPNATLVVAGSIADDNREECERLIAEDPNVRYLGWTDSDTLSELLCACDLYVQPGAQSATMQMALCSRCPILLRAVPSHEPFVKGNGWLVRDESDILAAFRQIRSNPGQLGLMAAKSLQLAGDLLDYRTLAQRILRPRTP